MDVKSAFLNGDLENEIFMCIPEGIDSKEEEVWLFVMICSDIYSFSLLIN